MISSLEECLLYVEYSIHIEHWHNVKGGILQQIYIEVIVVKHTVEELEYDVKWHLDRDCLPAVMGSSYQYGWSVLGWLAASLYFQ